MKRDLLDAMTMAEVPGDIVTAMETGDISSVLTARV